jgi:long-subunit acyl-CoA synthetase (AMP-forming)
MKNCHGDAKELRPTIMAGVPEVFERIRKTVEAQVNKQGVIAKYLFRAAFAFRCKLIDYSSTCSLSYSFSDSLSLPLSLSLLSFYRHQAF